MSGGSNRNPSFHAANSTARMVNHPALATTQVSRDGPGSAISTTLAHPHLHQKSSGNIESLSKQQKHKHSSSSIGKQVRMGVRSGNAKNQAIYNSNNQKMVEPQLSTRNAPNHSHFAPGMSDQPSGQAILRDLPISLSLIHISEPTRPY